MGALRRSPSAQEAIIFSPLKLAYTIELCMLINFLKLCTRCVPLKTTQVQVFARSLSGWSVSSSIGGFFRVHTLLTSVIRGIEAITVL